MWSSFALVLAAFLIFFPALWCAIVLFLSWAGGWQRLARHFAAGNRPVTGTRHGHVTGMVGWVSYRFVLTVHRNDDGFFLDINRFFRIGHPRLFIPWSAVKDRKPFSMPFWNATTLTIGEPVTASITIPNSTGL